MHTRSGIPRDGNPAYNSEDRVVVCPVIPISGWKRRLLCGMAMLLAMLAGVATSYGEVKVPGRPVLSPVTLGWLAHAGIIFGGTVVEVRPLMPTHDRETAMVQVTFQVTQAVRGSRKGQPLVVKEWAGNWVGHPLYRTGERVFVFLYKPNQAGITSELGGVNLMRVGPTGLVSVPPGWVQPDHDADDESENGDTPLTKPRAGLSGRVVGIGTYRFHSGADNPANPTALGQTAAYWARQLRLSLPEVDRRTNRRANPRGKTGSGGASPKAER